MIISIGACNIHVMMTWIVRPLTSSPAHPHILSDIKVWNLCWPIHLKRSFTILALSSYSHAIRQEETPSDGKCGHSVYLGSQLTSFLGAFNPVELYIHFH